MAKLARTPSDKGRTFARAIKHRPRSSRKLFASRHSRQTIPQPSECRELRKHHWLKGIRP